jgi:hypothetical protein
MLPGAPVILMPCGVGESDSKPTGVAGGQKATGQFEHPHNMAAGLLEQVF